MQYIEDLYRYFDSLVEDGTDDELFASSYIRGFVLLVVDGRQQLALSAELYQSISDQLEQARSELSPQDRTIVGNYWQTLQAYF